MAGRNGHRGPRGSAVSAQPGSGVTPAAASHGPRPAMEGLRHRRAPAVSDRAGHYRVLAARGDVGDASHGLAVVGQAQLRGRLPLPGQAVAGSPDHSLCRAVAAFGHAGCQEAIGCAVQHPHLVAGQHRGDAMGARKRPGQAIGAGPDGLRANRQPPAGTACHPGGRIAHRGLAPARLADRGQPPRGPAIGGHEELLAYHAAGGL